MRFECKYGVYVWEVYIAQWNASSPSSGMRTSKVMDKLTNYSLDIHIQIRHVISLNFGRFHIKFGPKYQKKIGQNINIDKNCNNLHDSKQIIMHENVNLNSNYM